MRSWKKKASASLAVSLLTASILPMPGHALHAAEVETAAPANTTTNTIVDQQTTGHVHATFQTALSSASVQNDTYAITTARAQAIGSTVTVQGVVTYREDTGSNYSNLYIQDGQAGIVIRGQAFTVQAGDTIQVTGKLGAYQKLLQIAATSSNVETIQSGTVPQPKTIDSSGFATGNPNEATLVKVSQVHVDSVSGNRYTLSDANGTFVVYTTNAWLKSGYTYTSITGVITRYQDTYQLLPRSTSDIEGGDQAPPSGQEPLRLTINQIQGTAQTSTYAEQQVQGVEGIVTMVKSRSSFYMQMPDELADNDPRTSEGILVYRSAHGVKPGDHVQIDGSVKEYRETGYADAADLTTTEIAASSIKVLAENQPLPAPTIIGPGGRSIPEQIASVAGKAPFDPAQYSIDFYESLEGMRVQLNDADIIGPYTYEIPVTVDAARHARRTPAGGLIITDGDFNSDRLLIASKPSQPIKTGDRFNGAITGIMSYSYSNFKILPDQPLPPVQDGGWKREVSQLQNGPQQLTIASFNVENFWNDPAATDKTQKIARDVVDNLHTPDILALMEVQDNNGATDDGTTDASQNFEALIAAIQAAGGPTYRYASIAPINNQDGGAPGGNIRVGFLYNPQRVTLPVAPGGTGDSVTAVTYGATGLSVNPGRIDPGNVAFEASRKSLAAQFVFNGQSVIVIANHFNSKGGDQALYGAAQPPVRSSEIQRARQAAVLNNFVKDTLARNSNANIVLVGDFNDFQFSNTFNILKGKELTNLVDTLPVNERYSYVYEGNSQTLDHVLMTSQLAARAQLDIVHINSDFMEEDGRVSDHDPLLTRIDFTPKSDSKDKDKDRGTTTTPGTNTNTDTAPSGGAGTAPITPTASSEPVAQGVSENGQLARWTITPELQQEGNRMVATSVIDAAAAQRMLNNTATTLQLDLQATSAVNSFQVHIQQAAGTALTSQSQLQQITINTPLGQYHLPASLVKQALTDAQRLELEISSDSTAVQEAQAAGYTPYAAVAYTINTIATNGNKTAVRELGQYVKRTIASNAIQTGQRIAVMRLEQNSTGKVQYTPVPFSIQSGQITLLSNTNSSYIALRAEEPAFRDMQGHWAQAVVQQLRDTGVIQGQSNTQFTPTAGVTRAEFAAMLTRALGVSTLANVSSSSNTSFADVPASAWYASSVQAATNAGWIKGDEKGDFRPNAQVTRQEMAVMLQRAWSDVMTNSNNTSTNTDNSNTSSQRLTDTATIASWALPAVQQLVTAGLIEGNAEARFQPIRSLSRAESAAVISRLINEITRS